ncbi:outer envelope pore protein 16-2, chloroplastic-like isoform X3 [Cucurbita pepo subsp. pepo]|uniref:outer envelope pore protein 16-2, chloroplastic-like isoform X3 n=1 Tax=Cucurbita pepo subsp. pepo TaxID=3664 RepID=UPI000C9D460C|nr:outer envelope pore protein 16-2, chloroplastic-like isoform X3 [Cucurbita pepo subsp. pepo]
MGSRSLENRSVVDEIKCSQGGTFLYDFGHPLLNRVADSFIKAAGIGALQSVSREAYFTVAGSLDSDNGPPPELSSARKRHVPGLKGETNKESLEAMVKSVGQESIQWGLAAGVYSGLTYGLKEARGAHDWNSAIAGAVTGVAVALASDDSSHERIVQSAITGAAVSAAANIFAGIF